VGKLAAHRFTPAMTEKLKQMASRGYDSPAIAVELAKMTPLPITAESVRKKCCQIGLRLRRRDTKYRAEVRCTVALDVWEKLRKMANARGLSVARFCQLFIEVATDEGYISKIVDERRPRSRRRRSDLVRIGRPRRAQQSQPGV
jgi:hypothetical protein